MKNPWINLPDRPPYILPEDAVIINSNTFKSQDYHFEAFPDPFIGNIDEAKVIFLSLNPGFENDDVDINLAKPFFLEESRRNIRHKPSVPFLYLDERMSDTHGYRWWHKLLDKSIKEEPLNLDTICKRIAIIEYMPYHSVTYTPNKLIVPSQMYAFYLVRKAMAQKKIIVIMRRGKVRDWIKAIPEIANYPYITFNSQRPYVTRANMTRYNTQQQIDDLFEALK